MSDTPTVDIAARLRNGGRKGGQAAGIARRARRQRYLDGTMTDAERETYQRVLDLAKRAGSKGGAKTSAKHRAEKRAALVEAGFIAPPSPERTEGGQPALAAPVLLPSQSSSR